MNASTLAESLRTLLHPLGASTYWTAAGADVLAQLRKIAGESGYRICGLAGERIKDKETLLLALAWQLSFPDYFGVNWDALDECLRDLPEWLPEPGWIMMYSAPERLHKEEPDSLAMLVDCFEASREPLARRGRELVLILLTSNARLIAGVTPKPHR